MNDCETCRDLNVKFDIRFPSEIKRVLEIAKQSAAGGALSVLQEETPFSEPFHEVRLEGPWDDIVSYVFYCNACGRKFEFCADTYHGSGGAWKPL